MDENQSFNLSLDFEGQRYEGTVTPSEEKGANGLPVFSRVMLGNQFFAYLCCGDKGWSQREGSSAPKDLIQAIGNYIEDYYEVLGVIANQPTSN